MACAAEIPRRLPVPVISASVHRAMGAPLRQRSANVILVALNSTTGPLFAKIRRAAGVVALARRSEASQAVVSVTSPVMGLLLMVCAVRRLYQSVPLLVDA